MVNITRSKMNGSYHIFNATVDNVDNFPEAADVASVPGRVLFNVDHLGVVQHVGPKRDKA